MLKHIINKIKRFRSNLTSLNDQAIGKTVFTIIIFLDVFILISVFQGLSDHTRQLATPNEFIPQYCRDIVIDDDWNQNNRLIRTAGIVTRYRSSYVHINEKDRVKSLHPVCAPISKLLRSIEDDKTLASDLNAFLRNRNHIVKMELELKRTSGAYNTALLEVIAEQNSANENQAPLKKKISELTDDLNGLVSEEAKAESKIMQDERISRLFSMIERSPKVNRGALLEALRDLNFWYPVNRLGMEMLFLLPLIFIFYLWNAKSVKASRPYQSLVSAHLLVVVFIPVIFKIVELIYDIVPKKLLKQVFEFLESFNLIAIWHYAMMGIAVITALSLIYFMQKKIFSQEKITQKRIIKGQCQNCGCHLPNGNQACSICGFKQFRQCGHCKGDTYVYGQYCKECGLSE